MKNIFTVLLLSFTLNTQAQKIIFSENFEFFQSYAITGWFTGQTTNQPWRTSNMYTLFCEESYIPQHTFFNKVAAVSDCHGIKFGPRDNSNVFMYTPLIDLSGVTGPGVAFRYDSYFNKTTESGKTESAYVEVSVNSGTTWTKIQTVPAGPSKDSFKTWYLDLTPYKGQSNVQIGFRYNDGGGDQQQGGWTIDNVAVFEVTQKDLSLVKFTPVDSMLGYVAVNNSFKHTGTVLNLGVDTVKAFTVNYMRDNSPVYTETFNSVSIPPFAEYSITHNVPDTILNTGKTNITAWVSLTGDGVPANDTFRTFITGAHFTPTKRVLIEEGTGTWSPWAPRGIVYQDIILNDEDACQVAVHSSDPMEMEDYSDYLYNLNYNFVPYFLFDRKINAAPETFFSTFANYKQHFGFADIELFGETFGVDAYINVDVKSAVDMKGDFRLILVLTEDDVSGTDTTWNQKNNFANNKYGPMGGFENRPAVIPASEMKYDFVARKVLPAPDGGQTFATELNYNGTYTHKFHVILDPSWDKNKMRAVIMLLRMDDSTVLNSNKLKYFLHTSDPSEKATNATGIYPNPANTHTTLSFHSDGGRADIMVTDINGRRMMYVPIANTNNGRNNINLNTAQLPTGLYIINVLTGENKHSLKMQVLH